jgi:RNA polymerase sigma-70 factor (sigma-E family)
MDAEAQESFREFVANRSSALLKTAVLLSGGDRHAGEDLLQNALLKAAGRWHRIDEPEAYVRQVLYRQQVSRWRLKWPRRELSVAEPPESAAGPDASGAAELRLVMRGALARLTARQRTVLVLRYLEDLPESEVAGSWAAPSAPSGPPPTAPSPGCAPSRPSWPPWGRPPPSSRRPVTTRPWRSVSERRRTRA